jgi:hypothetical protein
MEGSYQVIKLKVLYYKAIRLFDKQDFYCKGLIGKSYRFKYPDGVVGKTYTITDVVDMAIVLLM